MCRARPQDAWLLRPSAWQRGDDAADGYVLGSRMGVMMAALSRVTGDELGG